jgi:RHS repeat-associated protein
VANLYDFPARRYSSSQGRWISPDPLGRGAVTLTSPQTWNRYVYVNNNPLRLMDSTGTDVDNTCSGADDPDCGGDGGGGGGGGGDGSGGSTGSNGSFCGAENSSCSGGIGELNADGNNSDNSNEDNSDNSNDPNDPNKQQLVRGMLNPDCNAMYGGLANGLQAIAATQYVNINSVSPTNDQDAEALDIFKNNPTDAAYTFSSFEYGPSFPNVPLSITTYLGNGYYNSPPNVQTGMLFHEMLHGVGYPSADIDFGSYAQQLPQYSLLAENCSPQEVATETSDLPNSIPDPSD